MKLSEFYKKLFASAHKKDQNPSNMTSRRIKEVVNFFTQGYQVDDIVTQASQSLFDCSQANAQPIMIHDIRFVSLCEHHLLPMFGKCHIAYLPDQKILGLGRISEIVETFSRRLQLQEKLTGEIANAILETTAAKGVAVMLEAQHFCMVIKGIEKLDQKIVTTTLLGDLQNHTQNIFKRP